MSTEEVKALARSIAAEFLDFDELVYISPGGGFSANPQAGNKVARFKLNVAHDPAALVIAIVLIAYPTSGSNGYFIRDSYRPGEAMDDFASRWRTLLKKAREDGAI